MTNKVRMIRLALSGALLVVVVLTAVAVYQTKSISKKQQEELAQSEEDNENVAQNNQDVDSSENTQETPPESTDVSTNDVEAVQNQETTEENMEATPTPEETPAPENTPENAEETISEEIQPQLDFSETTLLEWPISGSVVMDYSMDKAVYFQTLNLYKYNSALIIGTQLDEPVKAVANSKVLSIEENAETGTTVSMDMGNGYTAIYGQLKDVNVVVDQVVSEGTVIAMINEPTKYYTKEGTSLYFAMNKDGESIDPVIYLP